MQTFVPSPSTRQPRYGLLSSLGGEAAIRRLMRPSEGGADRWIEGFKFKPFDCSSDTGVFDVTCGAEVDFTQSELPDELEYTPFGVFDSIKCSTMSGQTAELEAATRAKLDTSQSHKIEQEFWKGTFAQAQGYANDYLARDAHVAEIASGAARPLVYALMDLARELGEALQGSRGMIHARTDTVLAWASAGAVRREGTVWLDPLDNIVVAGSGYDGSAPDGALDATNETAWAYGTSIPDVRLSDVEVTTFVDATNNVEWFVAFRAASVTFDDCAHLGVNVDMCTPCCTPS